MPECPVDYDDLPAGPELDALVAERVMGWSTVPPLHSLRPWWYSAAAGQVGSWWQPSSSPNCAALVTERLRLLDWVVQTQEYPAIRPLVVDLDEGEVRLDGRSVVTLLAADFSQRVVTAMADTTPLALCRAALKAVADE